MPTRFRASTPEWTSGAISEPAAPARPDAAPRVRRVKPITLVRVAVFLAALVPAARLVWGFYTNDLTANPGDYITDQTGTWTLGMLFSSLSITPLRRFTGWNELIKLRRMLGLFAFFYAVLHMLTWVVFIHYFDVSFMVEDVVKRPFITVGMTVFVILFVAGAHIEPLCHPEARAPLAVPAPARLRGGDRRRDPLLVAGEGRHHRAAAVGDGPGRAARAPGVVGLPQARIQPRVAAARGGADLTTA